MIRRPMSPRKAWKRMRALQRLAEDPATTQAERDSAQRRLDEHKARYAKAVQDWAKNGPSKPPGHLAYTDTTRVGTTPYRPWRRGDELSPGLWRGIPPDGALVLVAICTVRKAHRCYGCGAQIPKRGRAWRAVAYNGNHRMHRFCTHCWAPDPAAVLQIPTGAKP